MLVLGEHSSDYSGWEVFLELLVNLPIKLKNPSEFSQIYMIACYSACPSELV